MGDLLICFADSEMGPVPAFLSFAIAELDEGTLYPPYNTEHHPFFSVTLDDVNHILKEKN